MNLAPTEWPAHSLAGPWNRVEEGRPVLSVHELKKYFRLSGGPFGAARGYVQAVDGVSFSVARGETLGVVGESGCGKSTTARLLIRLIKPDQGRILLDGQDVEGPNGISVRALRHQVQMVFQDSYASLNPRHTSNNGDPIGTGLVASLARPGGNITGLSSTPGPEIYGKDLELLTEIVPKLTRVAVLTNPAIAFSAVALKETEKAAQALRLSLLRLEARSPSELGAVFTAAITEQAGAVLVAQDPMLFGERTRLADLAARSRLPAIYALLEHVEAGGLMAYAANRLDMFRRAATYVDKILKGVKPADLPVERPTKFELWINLTSAKQIGLTIPPSVLARADKVIR